MILTSLLMAFFLGQSVYFALKQRPALAAIDAASASLFFLSALRDLLKP